MADFKLVLAEEKRTVEKADGTEGVIYIRELAGRELEAYLNSQRKNVVLTDGKVSGMKSFDGMYSNLLAACCYDEDNVSITKADIDLWPASMQKALFGIAQEISGLGADEKEDEGGNA